jgi:hypothetical protein
MFIRHWSIGSLAMRRGFTHWEWRDKACRADSVDIICGRTLTCGTHHADDQYTIRVYGVELEGQYVDSERHSVARAVSARQWK